MILFKFSRHEVQLSSREVEVKHPKQYEKSFNPFTEREVKNPTS